MVSQISNASAIRSSGWSIRAYATFVTGGTPVATGTLTNAPTYPSGGVSPFLSTTYVTGAYTDVRRGMEVVLRDATTNAFKGRTRVRVSGTINVGALPVPEFSKAMLNLSAGDKFAIYDEYRLHAKIVAALLDFPPEMLFYSDQGSNPPPLACSGGHWAGWVDAGQTYATVLTKGDLSVAVDPDSGGSLTHLWELPSGVSFAPGSSSSDANPTLRVNAGEWTVHHTITDDDNSKAFTQHIVMRAHDAAQPPHRVRFTPDDASADVGFGGTVQIVSGATTQAAIPDGCLCLVWGVEYLNGAPVAFRNAAPGRGHILCVGIVRRDTQSGTPDGARQVSFELISPQARLKELTSYSKVMISEASPDSWSELKALGVKRAVIQIIQFYTTLVEAGFDVVFDDDFIDYLYAAFYEQRGDFFDQLNRILMATDARMPCDRTGRFDIHTDPKFLPEASRAAVTKQWRFNRRDVIRFEFPREHHTTIEQMKVSGFSGGATNNQPYFSLYPGKAVGEGVNAPVRERLIVDPARPQADLNERAGRYGAALDLVYQNSDGELYRAFPATLVLRGIYDFFDFSKEYIDFSENLSDLARDVDLTKFLFCVKSRTVDYDFELGTATTTYVFDVVTNAAEGETFIPTPEGVPDYTPPDFVPPPYVPPSTGVRLPPWNGVDTLPTKLFTLAANDNLAHVASAWNPATSSPSYTDISTGLGGTYGIWATSNPYDYRERLALMDAGLYREPNIWSPTTWTQVATPTALFADASGIGTAIYGSINRRGFYIIPTGSQSVAITFDNGATWAQVGIGGSYAAGTAIGTGTVGIGVSARNSLSSGRLYAIVGSPFSGITFYRSDNWGVTWTSVATNAEMVWDTNITVTPRINIPYTRRNGTPNLNDASQEIYLVAGSGGTRGQVIFSNTAGATWTTVYYQTGGGSAPKPRGSTAGYNIMTFTHDADIVFWAYHEGVQIAGDGGVTPTAYTVPNTGDQETFVNGFASHSQAVLVWNRAGTAGNLRWTVDAGANWVGATLPSGVTFLAYAEWDLSDFVAPG